MATQVFYTGNGTTGPWNLTFSYEAQSEVLVTVDGVDTAYTWASASSVSISPAPVSGASIRVYRKTAYEARKVDFTDGSVLTERDLDDDSLQTFNKVQEMETQVEDLEGRAIRAKPGDAGFELPAPEDRVNGLLGFDEDGEAVITNQETFRGLTGPANSTYATTEALEAAEVTNLSAILTEGGKSGTFTIKAYTDFTNQVIADPEKVNFIRSTQDPTKVWVRVGSELVSVKLFGAKGDNTTDDSPAFAAAAAHVRAIRNGALYIPAHAPGSAYRLESPIPIDGPINIIGAHPDYCTLMATDFDAGTFILDFDLEDSPDNQNFSISNITLRSNNGAPDGINLTNASYISMSNVWLRNLRDGHKLSGTRAFTGHFNQVTTHTISRYGFHVDEFTGGGHFTFVDCTFNGDVGFYASEDVIITQLTMVTPNFEQCGTAGLRYDGTLWGCSMPGVRTEGGGGNDLVFSPNGNQPKLDPEDPDIPNVIQGLSITGGQFHRDATASSSIVLGGGTGSVRGFSIAGNTDLVGTGSLVNLNGEGESGMIVGNKGNTATWVPVNAPRDGVIVFGNESSAGKSSEYWGTIQWGVNRASFTPVDASGANLTLTAVGRYIRVGPMVHWQMLVTYPANANGAAASIGGLPFAVLGGAGNEGRSGGRVDLTDAGMPLGILQGYLSTTSVSLFNSQSFGSVTNANLSGKTLYLSGSYTV